MSEVKQILELSPVVSVSGLNTETITINGFECPACSGRGHFMAEKVGHDEWQQQNCDHCGGSGEMCADILVQWIKNKKNKK
jgi:DnaJ-class molecular chaperone